MNYEKKYKEALEWARKVIQGKVGFVLDEVLEKFPELAESEDERIRKALMQNLKERFGTKGNMGEGLDMPDVLAWFEKQGKKGTNGNEREIPISEKKPVDKVEPKFKVGYWLVHKDMVGVTSCITQIHAPHYYLTNNNSFIKFGEEDNYRPWTIQDAKDGDVLYSPCCKLLWIYKDCNSCYIGNNLNYNENCVVVNSPICIPTDVVPATKEQRDLLFQEMKEAGYEWDAKQKKLKKIKQKPAIKIELDDNGEPVLTPFEAELFSMMSEAWQCYSFGEEVNIAKIVKEHSIELLERANEQKPAWTEEDKNMISKILSILNRQRYWEGSTGEETYAYKDEIKWLKSLKDRLTWKPSDEQLDNLSRAFNGATYNNSLLMELYIDLKKLKG